MTERRGDVLDGRYRLDRRVGTGGTSDVWAATDQRLERQVAVKIVRIDPDDVVAAQRGPAEARLLGGLTHPHLVSVYDAHFPADGEASSAYLVMELVEGGTLALSLSAGPLEPLRAREVVAEVASALAYMHGRGVIHRDVKPANILFARDGGAKLTDFGIARVLGSPGLTQTGLLMGTAPYLSPEQVRGAPPTPASDVYSLGLVLLEALTGTRAYPGTASESAIARLTRRPDVPPWLTPDLAAVVEEMTDDDPAARPTAIAVSRQLGARPVVDGAGLPETAAIQARRAYPTAVLAPADIPTVAVRRPRRRTVAAWLALPVAAVVAVVIALLSHAGNAGLAPSPQDLPTGAAVAAHTSAPPAQSPTTQAAIIATSPAHTTPAAGPPAPGGPNGKVSPPGKHHGKGPHG
ncbi:MAG TPA: protein kinase [Mycobacteriales bacterium]